MSATNTQFDFSLSLDQAEYQRYYKGSAQNVLVWTRQGIKVQFPASALRPFVSAEGVHGRFVLTMDANNKLVSLQKV